MNPRYPRVAARAGHRCEYCRAPEAIIAFRMEVEHIRPAADGGTNNDDKTALACRACNLFKADALVAVDSSTQKTVRLFHPRTDAWEEHFTLDHKSGLVLGQTDIGRATVEKLRMNSERAVRARRLWIRLGLMS